jgi:acetoin utilization deacetylase AcuC-like enzyme
MAKTAVIYTDKYLDHDPGRGHPESANRLKVIMDELKRSGILETEECSLLEPKPAGVEDIELVHKPDYIKLIERYSASGGGLLDMGDTVVSPKSYETAVLAAGGAIEAANLVMKGEFQNAFALVRPPGHHAGPYYALGFCLFNNAAIAAAHLIRRFGLERIAILDIDAHHGNGTQEIFYDTYRVLYVSLHQDPTGFPGTGFVDEVGEGEGLGYTVNVPLPFRVDDQTYLKALDQIVIPIVQQYKPQFILASAGFDTHYTDPVASLSLSASGCLETFEKALSLASQLCGGRFVAVLEGGYSLNFLGKMATAAVSKMAGLPYEIRDKGPAATPNVQKLGEEAIKEAKETQSSFWNLQI